MATNPATNPKSPYNPLTDFVPISNLANVPNVITVHPSVKASNLKEFVALLKANPGKLSYASSGTGGISHLDGELFKQLSGTFMLHIPYRGSGPALNDTLAGQVQVQFDNLPSSIAHVRAGKLRALAVAAPKRVEALSDVPTFGEQGMPQMDNMAWYGLVAPAKTSPEIVARVHAAVVKTLADPDVRKRLADGGSIPDGNTPQQFAAQIKKEYDLRKKIATDRKIVLD